MTAEQLQRARRLFEAVAGEGETARADILHRECQGDAALLSLVEQMLDADAQIQPILDQPRGLARDPGIDSGELQPGHQVGAYRVIREIGVGGMGAVYQAELADAPGSGFVAIKVVRWYSLEISRRFQREQAILSGLQHPNIARLLDSGTTGNRNPYFVMEYVDGLPISSYCEARSLSISDRIRIFRQVCAAVAYLHQHLVVHRDLKPGNVLVTADGVVKLVDFGIAKLLQTREGLSAPAKTIAGLMTPDYASPEQIRGAATSTLSDVYSLGVLLYELLAGERPFTAPLEQVHETLRRICEEEPRKPSQAGQDGKRRGRELKGELDNIILKAIRKEPERRYGSAEQLDEDLRRYLSGQPVLAHGDSIGYRVRKFVTRYKGPVAAATAMLLLLTGGVVATSIEAGVARRERSRAELQAQEADRQRADANAQRALAEEHARDADRERANAERRLGELQKLAKGVVRIYDANAGAGQDSSGLISDNVRDSLLALRQEQGLEPGLADVLTRIAAASHSSVAANPPSWDVPQGWSAVETKPREYQVGRDPRNVHSGKWSIFLRSSVARPAGSVFVFQNFDASPYRGKRVRLTAFLRTQGPARHAGLDLIASFESGRAMLSGTTAWKKCELVVDVPVVTEAIRILLTLEGAGTLWADDFKVEQVNSSVPLTLRRPENLTFTEP